MKIIKGIIVNKRGTVSEAEKTLRSLGIEPSVGRFLHVMGVWFWDTKFDESDNRWRLLVDWAKKNRATVSVGTHIEYSKQELEAAQLLHIRFEVDMKGDIGPSKGTKYDLTGACPYCNSGAAVVPPFCLEARALPKKRIIAESHQEVALISGVLLEELQDRPGSQSWLIPVADSKSAMSLAWAAILPRATLPRVEKATKGFFRYMKTGEHEWGPCPVCDQDNWSTTGDEPFQPVYSRSKVQEACNPFLFLDQDFPDAAATWERIYSGARPNGPDKVSTPFIFVNQKIYQILKRHAGKYLRAIPATLID